MDIYATAAKEKMIKTIESFKSNLNTLRTGRASAAILENLLVNYYGEPTPVTQISSISIPEPRQILIKPYDKDDVKSIISAINASTLGLNPINDGTSIRLNIPPLTEERRRELAKTAKKYAEDGKIAIRNIRRDANSDAKNDKSLSEDALRISEEAIQKVTDELIREIDSIYKIKEEDIMRV